jgi:ankyrin repeat protein
MIIKKISLLNHGADISEVDSNDRTALHMAIKKIYNAGFELLLERKANVNIADNEGRTPLHLAAYYNNERFCNALLKREGIEVNLIDKEGNTALDLAIQQGSAECSELLRRHGAKESNITAKERVSKRLRSESNLSKVKDNSKPREDLGSSSPDASDDETSTKGKEAKQVKGEWSERVLDQQVGKKRKRDDIEESLKGP